MFMADDVYWQVHENLFRTTFGSSPREYRPFPQRLLQQPGATQQQYESIVD